VINTVKDAVKAKAYHPLLAAETKLHPNLWENVECQMLACPRGIAIVEDRFNPKLNPNVAMESGWMRAMKKPVLYLVEKAVPASQSPADVMGLISSRFDWDNPEADIPRLIAEDLPLIEI
jgi:nucleoside 2-deoxyribosyltransferase